CLGEGARGNFARILQKIDPPVSWRIKGEYDSLAAMADLRSCIVSYRDLEGITHSVEVTAESLYEAAILGIVAMKIPRWRDCPWLDFGVRSKAPETTHTVANGSLSDWLDRNGKSPREQSLKARLLDLLKNSTEPQRNEPH